MSKREKGTRVRGSFARSGHRSHAKGARRFIAGKRKSELQDKLASDAERIAKGLGLPTPEGRAFVRRVAKTNPLLSQRGREGARTETI